MAIDTREKRASVPGVGRPFMRGKNPNAAKDQAWRMATGNVYAGNALSPDAAVDEIGAQMTFIAAGGLQAYNPGANR